RRRAQRSTLGWRACRRHGQHPTTLPSRSACSANSWNGASSRNDNDQGRGYRLREAQLYGLDQTQDEYSAAHRGGSSTARAAGSRLQRFVQLGVTACVALGITVVGDGTPARPAEAQQRAIIVVPTLVKAQPASRTRLPIEVNSPDTPARNSFLRIRGLPTAAALSDGYA